MEQLAQLIALTLAAGTPLVYAALGELVTEKSGVLNLGVEGMMLVGAVAAFAVAATTKSPWLGVGAGILAGGTNARTTSVPHRPGTDRLTVGVATGPAKVRSIRAALAGHILTGLITDEATATALLDS